MNIPKPFKKAATNLINKSCIRSTERGNLIEGSYNGHTFKLTVKLDTQHWQTLGVIIIDGRTWHEEAIDQDCWWDLYNLASDKYYKEQDAKRDAWSNVCMDFTS
jgi:hypothetical protein